MLVESDHQPRGISRVNIPVTGDDNRHASRENGMYKIVCICEAVFAAGSTRTCREQNYLSATQHDRREISHPQWMVGCIVELRTAAVRRTMAHIVNHVARRQPGFRLRPGNF